MYSVCRLLTSLAQPTPAVKVCLFGACGSLGENQKITPCRLCVVCMFCRRDGQDESIWINASAMYTCALFLVTVVIALLTKTWHWIHVVAIIVSPMAWILFFYVQCSIYSAVPEMYFIAQRLYVDPYFWMMILVSNAAIVVLHIAYSCGWKFFWLPTALDIINGIEHIGAQSAGAPSIERVRRLAFPCGSSVSSENWASAIEPQDSDPTDTTLVREYLKSFDSTMYTEQKDRISNLDIFDRKNVRGLKLIDPDVRDSRHRSSSYVDFQATNEHVDPVSFYDNLSGPNLHSRSLHSSEIDDFTDSLLDEHG